MRILYDLFHLLARRKAAVKRCFSAAAALALTLALTLSSSASPAAPYLIAVNRATCTVTVYTKDSQGNYTVPCKAMVCSVGKRGRGTTPTGVFSLTGYKPLWCRMKDGSYGQYVSQFRGNYLFHSVCYHKADPSTLMAEEYNDLGQPASLGCVRLQTADAKWIYDNCPGGTRVRIFDGTAQDDPLGKPDKLVAYIDPAGPNAGWDPTDEREENPWHAVLAQPTLTAAPACQTLELDGAGVELSCCALPGETGGAIYYVRLRDLAAALNGTPAQFGVGHFGVVNLAKGWPYCPDGSENAAPLEGEQSYQLLAGPTNVDGVMLDLPGLLLTDSSGGGHVYYKLRDLARALDFNVGWSAHRGVFLETDVPYDPAN